MVLDNANLLQSLQDLSVDGAGGVGVLVWSKTSVDGTTVLSVQLTNTNLLLQVDLSGSGSSSLVEPTLGFLRWQLVAGRGLDELNVTWDLQLTLTLQELSVSVDELLGWNVSMMLVMRTGTQSVACGLCYKCLMRPQNVGLYGLVDLGNGR